MQQHAQHREQAHRRAEGGVAGRGTGGAHPGAEGEGGDAGHLAQGGAHLVPVLLVDPVQVSLHHLLLPLRAVVGGQQTQDGAVALFEHGRHAVPPAIPGRRTDRLAAAGPAAVGRWAAIRWVAARAPAAIRSASADRAAPPASVRR